MNKKALIVIEITLAVIATIFVALCCYLFKLLPTIQEGTTMGRVILFGIVFSFIFILALIIIGIVILFYYMDI